MAGRFTVHRLDDELKGSNGYSDIGLQMHEIDVKLQSSHPNKVGIDNLGLQIHENDSRLLETVCELPSNTPIPYGNENGPMRKKSIVQLTREALPRLENYRNSRRALKRPSIGELLHGRNSSFKDISANTEDKFQSDTVHQPEGIKLGWIQGVMIPCLLNIWGVMLFLRLAWVVAQAGVGQSLLIIAISAAVCVITSLSLSAICTNGEVKTGGIYFIISRSLGPEFGASVGIVFAFANAVSASMNTIGFCNSLNDLLSEHDLKIVDGGDNDVRIVGTIAIAVMILICAIGMEWESKAQNFLIAIIVAAMMDFIIGVIMGPKADEEQAKGFTGFQWEVFSTNWFADYRYQDNTAYDFFQVFAIFFPSVTGIQAGANISGDLKDPASSIPKGTLLALLISMVSYTTFVIFAGAAALRDASGSLTDLANGTLRDCVKDFSCSYGLFNSYTIMQLMAAWAPFIYAGCWAATLSTALTNLLSVPRLIQALGKDKIYPGLIFFSKGYGKAGEPYRGYVLTFFVSSAFLLIANLNAVAPLISNFYLASYALINFCTFHAALIKPLGWRPTFKYYNTWLSLVGFMTCIVIMFLISWLTSIITCVVIIGLYLVVVYRKPDVNWGSSTQAQMYKTALTNTLNLMNISEHVKNYRPQVLLFCGKPSCRTALLDFANLITKNNSLLLVAEISEENLGYRTRSGKIKAAYDWLRKNKIKGFYTVIDGTDRETGAKALFQTAGIGKLIPNILLLGYKNDWRNCTLKEIEIYFNILHAAFENRFAVAILRIQGGLDHSKLTGEEDPPTSNNELSLVNSSVNQNLHTSASTHLMRVDSNVDIAHINIPQNVVTSSYPTINFAVPLRSTTSIQSMKRLKIKKKDALEKVISSSEEKQSQIPNSVWDKISLFRRKQPKGTIDVWWLYDDGGLTMLLPYIISTRSNWSSCKLRVFALVNNKNELETEERNMANLLSKFRLDYSSLQMVQINDKPRELTVDYFNQLIENFKERNDRKEDGQISEIELITLQEKTNRLLRLRELLIENSNMASLIFMSLPMPRKGSVSPALYMAWLEVLTENLPPYVLVRGNQQSVLTYYS